MAGSYSQAWPKPANGTVHTLTGLKRWSCEEKQIPSVDKVKSIHVYDFDNTLFRTPLPNKQIWHQTTIGSLQNQDAFVNGGWWHDNVLLTATGEGLSKEEPRAWNGWWNEEIVRLVELSMEQNDALCVLLTGRSERNFADIIKRMAKSKKLEFDMTCLKPAVGPRNQKFASTQKFKQDLLWDIVYTYKDADEIRVYEDRPKHVKAFKDFFQTLNQTLLLPDNHFPRKAINAEVIQVPEDSVTLDPVVEVTEIQRMINNHNITIREGKAPEFTYPFQINRSVFYTGYMISPETTNQLVQLVNLPENGQGDIQFLANNILITPRSAPPHVLEKAGGIGRKLHWRVTGLATLEGKLWAARVAPVPENAKYYTDDLTPSIVLALKRGARPGDVSKISKWSPVSPDNQIEFDTTVGEKVLLKIERERNGEDEQRFQQSRNDNPRKHP
ncbi:MAG: hypothetical protein M1820_010037, partial [Bogoriella megaspora]